MNFIPYGKQNISDDDINEVIKVLKSPFITTGPKAKEFEDALSLYCGSKYTVVVSNGTAALHLSSLVLLEKDDKVLTTPNSFLATSNSILYVGAKPVFVDICENGNIDLDLCEKELIKDKSIKAIYAVAFSGNPLNQNKLRYLKDKYNIKVLEDNAHAIGSSFEGIKSGSCVNSDISIFSFHPVKHITTGEGGAITTNNKDIYEKLLLLRSHGMKLDTSIAPWHYDMSELGFNYRITDIQCALGISQLKRLDLFIKRRKEIVLKYEKEFLDFEGIKPLYKFNENSSYHLYVLRIDFEMFKISKKDFVLNLRELNVGCQYHYIPINKQPFYKNLGYGTESTPYMDEYYKSTISIPMYYSLSDEEQNYVIKSIKDILCQN
ncbi:MAG: UDP-4-amino-4,6-dideoxy-N-acetyl-beta-L-altrosamine transaminase [Campylobacteraceae bacterium]|nr:UDP-4-amino-4,6-dideoxy-N-acetyl-beta-L-altrosamine transaminase [Campylobacteraceae bacterium]